MRLDGGRNGSLKVSAISEAYARRRARLTEALDRWRPAGSASLPRLPMPTLHERGGETLRQFVAAMAAAEARPRAGAPLPSATGSGIYG